MNFLQKAVNFLLILLINTYLLAAFVPKIGEQLSPCWLTI